MTSNTDYIDLTLWVGNTALFHNIKTYLCDENNGELYYVTDQNGKMFYNHSCSYKSRGYMAFLNHIDNLSKFQKILKLYYKKKREKFNMSQKQIYIVFYNSDYIKK